MNSITLLQISGSVIRKSAEMAVTDPHGIIITVVSVLVVFASLAILHISYFLIGKVVTRHLQWMENKQKNAEPQQQDDPEVKAAIATALHLYLNENTHDDESYVITIKRKEYNETV